MKKKRTAYDYEKMCLLGGPYTGKTFLANKLANHFNIPIIHLQTEIDKLKVEAGELGEELLAFIESKQEEQFQLETEKYETAIELGKTWVAAPLPKDIQPYELPKKLLLKVMQKILRKNECINRGYVLDGFPRSYKECKLIFDSILNRKITTTK